MDLQAAWFATHFKPQQADPSDQHSASMLPEAVALAEALAPLEAKACQVMMLSTQPVRWWQEAAMAGGGIELPATGSMGDAPAANCPGFNAFKVWGRAGGV